VVDEQQQWSNGSPDPNFHGFGLAWHQSDEQVKSGGDGAHVSIHTIVVGPDLRVQSGDVALAPTNTFHVGFWFNNPTDAAASGSPV
jgi:hypothetical protein